MSFLNTKPLIYPLLNGEIQSEEIDLSLQVPSHLANLLNNNDLEIGLIPIVEYFRANDRGQKYRILPNISIASHGSVLSIQLFSRIPIQEIQHIALDTSSRSSVALLKILLAEKYKIYPTFFTCEPTINPATVEIDAVLLIGDSALKNLGATEFSLDLGTEWHDMTGLPFVYACWVARGELELGNVPNILIDAKKKGIKKIPEIVRMEAQKLSLSENLCQDYLQNRIHYGLDISEIEGLELFYKLCLKHKLVQSQQDLRFEN